MELIILTVGRNIESLRRAHRMTIRELSQRSQIGLATISDIENGKIEDVKLGTLYKLSKALNADLLTLICETDLKLTSNDRTLLKETINNLSRLAVKLKL